MALFSREPVRIEDTAKRAITLYQLEQILEYVKNEFETGGASVASKHRRLPNNSMISTQI